MNKKQLFLISSSRYSGADSVFFAHCLDSLGKFLGPAVPGHNKVAFFPYAKADRDYDGYTKMVSEPFSKIGYEVISDHEYMERLHVLHDPAVVAIFIGGGNTWVLLNELYERKLMNAIREEVMTGHKKYIGASAGTVVACPTIMTTNDMAPVRPPTFNALGLIPYQINPHFVPGSLVPKHMGETREERIQQVLMYNPDFHIIGLPEGCWIKNEGNGYTLCGTGNAKFFRKSGIIIDWESGAWFSEENMG